MPTLIGDGLFCLQFLDRRRRAAVDVGWEHMGGQLSGLAGERCPEQFGDRAIGSFQKIKIDGLSTIVHGSKQAHSTISHPHIRFPDLDSSARSSARFKAPNSRVLFDSAFTFSSDQSCIPSHLAYLRRRQTQKTTLPEDHSQNAGR